MWQRLTEKARRAVYFAMQEAARFGDNYVSTEHLLLGLVRESGNNATYVIHKMGISPDRIRIELEGQAPRRGKHLGTDMQLTPSAKRSIDLSHEEALQLGIEYVGTEHLLLGLLREGKGLTGRVLANVGVELEKTRAEAMNLRDRGILLRASQTTGHDLLRASSGKETEVAEDELLRGANAPSPSTPAKPNLLQRLRGGKQKKDK